MGDVLPGVRAVIGAIQPPVVLQEQSVRPIGMANDLVDALAEFRKPLRQEGDGVARYASSDGNCFADGIGRDAA